MKFYFIVFVCNIFLFISCSMSLYGQSYDPRYWIFFTDKGPDAESNSNKIAEKVTYSLSEQAIERRLKVRTHRNIVDFYDFPVHLSYIQIIEEITGPVVVTSRWLNAVSVPLQSNHLEKIKQLPFVKEIRPVISYSLPPEPEVSDEFQSLHAIQGQAVRSEQDNRFLYGPSETQILLHNIHELHNVGITGDGVIVGFLDTGYKWEGHEAFENTHIIAVRDFVQEYYSEDVLPHTHYDHGTWVFSVVSGFREERLVGVSFDSSFLLAATEDIRSERPIEEDFWVAGIEWMESLGVDIVSTSLGYSQFDPGYPSYTPDDMDGNTAVTTIAADRAFERGVVVVASAGNEGARSWRIVTSPADGKKVIAAGAINPEGILAAFSSRGPTADGRIKPDVSALGVGVFCASTGDNTYRFFSGTSASAPMVAGTAALVLSARRDMTNEEIRNALMMNAHRSTAPDNDYGWGILDAPSAIAHPVVRNFDELHTYLVSSSGLFPDSIKIHYLSSVDSRIRVNQMSSIALIDGRTSGGYRYIFPPDVRSSGIIRFHITAVDSSGTVKRFPAHPKEYYHLSAGDELVRISFLPEFFTLHQNFPNPFNSGTIIRFELPNPSRVSLAVYNVLGQKIETLVEGIYPAGTHDIPWHPGTAASGVYFYRIEYGGKMVVGRMVLVR